MEPNTPQKIFAYCERGQDPSFWAEPLNALTNGAFIVAGLACLALWLRRPAAERSILALGLVALMLAVGVGSFLFHTIAEPWSARADTLPIGLYMLLAVYVMARRFFGWPIFVSLGVLGLFLGLMALAFQARGLGLGFSVGYLPALVMLIAAGAGLSLIRRPEASPLLSAAAVFAVSLTLRGLDLPFCRVFTLADQPIGAHFLWHLLNAATLYLVSRAAVLNSPPPAPRPAGSA